MRKLDGRCSRYQRRDKVHHVEFVGWRGAEKELQEPDGGPPVLRVRKRQGKSDPVLREE